LVLCQSWILRERYPPVPPGYAYALMYELLPCTRKADYSFKQSPLGELSFSSVKLRPMAFVFLNFLLPSKSRAINLCFVSAQVINHHSSTFIDCTWHDQLSRSEYTLHFNPIFILNMLFTITQFQRDEDG